MASAMQATASLALWLHLRRRAALAHEPAEAVQPPPGEAPLLLDLALDYNLRNWTFTVGGDNVTDTASSRVW